MESYFSYKFCIKVPISDGVYEKVCDAKVQIDLYFLLTVICCSISIIYYLATKWIPKVLVRLPGLKQTEEIIRRFFAGESSPLASSSLAEFNSKMFEDKKYCDMTLVAGDPPVKFPCHKLFVTARSPVFEAMLSDRWDSINDDDSSKEFEIPDVEPETLRAFLRFIYTEELETSVLDTVDLLQLAHMYDVPLLISRCEQRLEVMTTELEDAVAVYGYGKLHENARLLELAGGIIARSLKKVVDNKHVFGTMDKETLKHLLQSDKLKLHEVEIFKIVLQWGEDQLTPGGGESLKDVLDDVVALIRFPLMTAAQFNSVVIPTGLLSETTADNLLQYFNSDKTERETLKQTLQFRAEPRGGTANPNATTISFYNPESEAPPEENNEDVVFVNSFVRQRIWNSYLEFKASITAKSSMVPSHLLSVTKAVTIDSIIMYCPVITRQENADAELEDELGVTWTGKVSLLKAKNDLPFFTNDHEELCVAEEIELKFGESIEIRVNPPVTLEDEERYCIRVHQEGGFPPWGAAENESDYVHENVGILKTRARSEMKWHAVELTGIKKTNHNLTSIFT